VENSLRLIKKFLLFIFITNFFVAASMLAAAAQPKGVYFSHHDWELACDNTRTCRAAGYHSEDSSEEAMRLSVLLVRKAGPGEMVFAQLKLGELDEDSKTPQLPATFSLRMQINENPVGDISIDKNSLSANLSAAQTSALLAVLPTSAQIQFIYKDFIWRLSDKGAAAVLLKMDEFQGRLGTTTALVKKGKTPDNTVLPALPAVRIIKPNIDNSTAPDAALAASKALRKALQATISEEDCADLYAAEQTPELSLVPLSKNKILVSTQCWMAAYNMGNGYWVINKTPPFNPVLVTESGNDYADGIISAYQKGRGIGDCSSSQSWVWDGQQFVSASEMSTGMCRLISAGGTWELPTWVTEIVKGK
jgi:hypothetical protein